MYSAEWPFYPRKMGTTMGHELQPVQMTGPTYHKSQMSHPDQIHTSWHCLRTVPSAKHLVLTISDNLSWTPHIDSVSKKANQTLRFLERNIKVHNKDLKSTNYTTLVWPQLEYASTVWSPHKATDITKLETWSCTAQVSPLGCPCLPAHLECDANDKGPKLAHSWTAAYR